MPDDARVAELLRELLDCGGTPEEVCRSCPELLEPVRAGWRKVRAERNRGVVSRVTFNE
jgi:hypothetical protein